MNTTNTPEQITALACLLGTLGRTNGTRLFREESSDEKRNAQHNLCGRTHYVDDETLRYFHARVLSARARCHGLVFELVESTAADMHNKGRGFRVSLFDVFGTVLHRVGLDDLAPTRKAAQKLCDAAPVDLVQWYSTELARLAKRTADDLAALEIAAAAAPALATVETAAA